jgi:hypothetical protein
MTQRLSEGIILYTPVIRRFKMHPLLCRREAIVEDL